MNRLLKHLSFWLLILLWINPIFNSKGLHGWEFFQFNLVRLPLIAASTYLLIYYLLPNYLLQQKDWKKFGLAFGCLFIATNLLDRWLIGTSLIDTIMADTGLTYTFFNEIPLFRNAFLLLSIMGLATIYQLLKWQQQLELKLATNDKIRVTLPPIKEKKEVSDEFYLKSGNITHKLNWKDILYLEKDENYVVYHTTEKKYLERITLAKLSKKLPHNFSRIHKSFIVATNHIEHLCRQNLIINGEKLPIGRTYGKAFFEKLDNGFLDNG